MASQDAAKKTTAMISAYAKTSSGLRTTSFRNQNLQNNFDESTK
mgnify:CR=1 FL=1